ncbi:hypothetical protein F5Y03DRAFT_260983 [Xylaria venustula]|nr:hypothetical protein F5Y03DRAFT_260983 [Xylaria venustula]
MDTMQCNACLFFYLTSFLFLLKFWNDLDLLGSSASEPFPCFDDCRDWFVMIGSLKEPDIRVRVYSSYCTSLSNARDVAENGITYLLSTLLYLRTYVLGRLIVDLYPTDVYMRWVGR